MTGEKSVQINLIHGNGGGNEAKIRKSHTIAFPNILLGKNLFDHLLNLKRGPEYKEFFPTFSDLSIFFSNIVAYNS